MNAQATIFAGLTEAPAIAAQITAEAEAKREAKKASRKAEKPAKKEAKKPEAKKAETMQEQKPAVAEVDAIEAARVAFVDACLLRQKVANDANEAKGVGPCKTIEADLRFFGYKDSDSAAYARKILAEMQKLGFDLPALAAHFANTVAGKGKPYLAIKAITKARQMFEALATNDITKFDGYTYAVLVNMVQTGKALDSHDMMACVSKAVKRHSAQSKGVPVECIKDSSPNTASTQVSSTRGFLGDLGILKVSKGKQGDRPEWAETEQAQIVRAWFEKHCAE